MKIAGSTTLITGGASGLGRATAQLIRAAGGRVVLLDLAKSPGADVAKTLGEGALFAPGDVTSADEVAVALQTAGDQLGGVNVLVNCAGIGTATKTFGKSGPAKLDEFTRVIEVNLIGTFNCIRLAAARMARTRRTPRASAARSSTRRRSRRSTARSARPPTPRPRAASSA